MTWKWPDWESNLVPFDYQNFTQSTQLLNGNLVLTEQAANPAGCNINGFLGKQIPIVYVSYREWRDFECPHLHFWDMDSLCGSLILPQEDLTAQNPSTWVVHSASSGSMTT